VAGRVLAQYSKQEKTGIFLREAFETQWETQ
jgi:hypothetical protein